MEKTQERWRRPGIRLAILGLIAIAIYFLVIFVKQSLNLYQLTREVRAQEEVTQQIRRVNEGLRQRLAGYTDEQGRVLLAKKSLSFKEPGERVAIPVEMPGKKGGTAPEQQPASTSAQELASLPAWQKWLRVVFVPAGP